MKNKRKKKSKRVSRSDPKWHSLEVVCNNSVCKVSIDKGEMVRCVGLLNNQIDVVVDGTCVRMRNLNTQYSLNITHFRVFPDRIETKSGINSPIYRAMSWSIE